MKKSVIKNIMGFITTIIIGIPLMIIPVNAINENQTNIVIIDEVPEFNKNYIPFSMTNYSIDDKLQINRNSQMLLSEYKFVDIVLSKNIIIIEEASFSDFIDVFGKLENGKYINITDYVNCTVENPKVATWVYGRIIAEDKGETVISIEYNDLKKDIKVVVKNNIINNEINNIVSNEISYLTPSSYSGITRQGASTTANAMVTMQWTPTQNLYTWFGTAREPFYAGTQYIGIPYTQYYTQTTKNEFMYALNNANDFYTRVAYGSYLVPKYGNDCSGFLSICWGLTKNDGSGRTRWNTTDFYNAINNGTFNQISYFQINQSDALYKQGHVILANYTVQNSSIPGGGYLSAYEQTDIKARTSSYTFQQLNDMGYIAFTMF